MEKKATFGAGCFWGVEAAFRQLDGVTRTRVGYTGGTLENPTYEDVCSHKTGHAEVVEVSYDPERISYDQLLEVFWGKHDPTQLNRQGLGHRRSVPLGDLLPRRGAAGDRASLEGDGAGELERPDRYAGRAGGNVLRGGGLPPAVPREARTLKLYARAAARDGGELALRRSCALAQNRHSRVGRYPLA